MILLKLGKNVMKGVFFTRGWLNSGNTLLEPSFYAKIKNLSENPIESNPINKIMIILSTQLQMKLWFCNKIYDYLLSNNKHRINTFWRENNRNRNRNHNHNKLYFITTIHNPRYNVTINLLVHGQTMRVVAKL